MKKTLLLLIITLISNLVLAQFIKEKALNVQIGVAWTSPYSSMDEIADDGFFAQGEFVLRAASWLEFRPYTGLILTYSNGKDFYYEPTDEKAESKALLFGGKARLRVPTRWVAPFAEIGIGTSIGKFVTSTAFRSIDKSGIIYHIPFSFGLELGRNNDVDVAFLTYLQPSVGHYINAFELGLRIPLKN